jgi:hypothetical protein
MGISVMKIVNGFVCNCEKDTRLAKRGINPANPNNDPVKQQQLDAKHGVIPSKSVEEGKPGDFDPNRQASGAVAFGGSLAGETRSGGGAAVKQLIDLLA